MSKTIQLNHGHTAIVDDCDAHLSKFRWGVLFGTSGVMYAVRKSSRDANGKRHSILLHRAVLGLLPGDPMVDHINGDGLDCQRDNLRTCTSKENVKNVSGPRADNTSGYLGVHKNGSGFTAQIISDGVRHCLGTYRTAQQANKARLEAEARLWGIHPRRKQAHLEIES